MNRFSQYDRNEGILYNTLEDEDEGYSGETEMLYERLINCDSIEELKNEILPQMQSQRVRWIRKINEIFANSHYKKVEFAELCGISRQAFDRWLKGVIPQKRTMYIRIGFAAGYNLEQMNDFLKHYGQFPELYLKGSLEDAIYIFVLNSTSLEHSYKNCQAILQHITQEIKLNQLPKCLVDTIRPEDDAGMFDTQALMKKLKNVKSEDEMQKFVRESARSYSLMYNKFYSYVKVFVRINCGVDIISEPMSIGNLIGSWPSSMQQHFRAIMKGKWIPMRLQVIKLGLYLNMDLDEINEMLQYAKMAPLYPQNPLEGVIIFALEDAKLNNIIVADGREDLYEYVTDVLSMVHMNWIEA